MVHTLRNVQVTRVLGLTDPMLYGKSLKGYRPDPGSGIMVLYMVAGTACLNLVIRHSGLNAVINL